MDRPNWRPGRNLGAEPPTKFTVMVTTFDTPPPKLAGNCAVMIAEPVMPLVTVIGIRLVLAVKTTLPATKATPVFEDVNEITLLAAWALLIDTVSTELLDTARVSPLLGSRLMVGGVMGSVMAAEGP